jgi:hypothetical protein
MTKASSAKRKRAARLTQVINEVMHQCDLGVITLPMVQQAAKIWRVSQSVARARLGHLEIRGAKRSTPQRGPSGTFIVATCPAPSIGTIMRQLNVNKLKAALLKDFETIELKSGLSDGSGPKSKCIEIRADNCITADDKGYHAQLESFFSKCRALLRTALELDTTYPHNINALPLLPFRVFASLYPAHEYSGLGVHCDTHIGFGAVTLALTTDSSPDTSFFTTSNMRQTQTLSWPLKAGSALDF